jgi:hypothetical protein
MRAKVVGSMGRDVWKMFAAPILGVIEIKKER